MEVKGDPEVVVSTLGMEITAEESKAEVEIFNDRPELSLGDNLEGVEGGGR